MRRMFVILFSVVVASLLVVTPALAAPAPLPTNPLPAAAPPAWGAPRYHVVRAGETLFSIGRRYGVNPWSIASANHLYNANRIYAGQCLYIPAVSYYRYCGCGYYNRYGCCRW